MSITFTQEFLVWVSFFVLFIIHTAIAVVPHLTKNPKEAIGAAGFMHAIVTILYAAFYPVWFPVGVTP